MEVVPSPPESGNAQKRMALGRSMATVLRQVKRLVKRSIFRVSPFTEEPPELFKNTVPPAKPDYLNDSSAWASAAAPLGTPSSFANLVPPDEKAVPDEERGADVFFVHDTLSYAPCWNAPIGDPKVRERLDAWALPLQASAFNGACRVFAPRYRVASAAAATGRHHVPSGRAAMDLAYEDIVDAFDAFSEECLGQRPLVIAGVGRQGAMHAVRLLGDRIDNSDLLYQLVGCYAIGGRVPGDVCSDHAERRLQSIDPAITPEQCRCLIAWDVSQQGFAETRPSGDIGWHFKDGWTELAHEGEQKVISVNPLVSCRRRAV